MIALLVLACVSSDPSSSDDTSPGTTLVVVDSHATARAAAVGDTTAWAADPTVLVGHALDLVLADDETLAYAADGTPPTDAQQDVAPPPGEAACVERALDEGDLLLTFTCASVQGTVRLHHDRGGPTTLTFEEGFVAGDTPIEGSLALTAAVRSGEYTVAGDLAVGGTLLAFDLQLQVGEGLALSGEATVEATLDETTLACEVGLGEAEAPLLWTGGCTCPSEGTLDAAASALVVQLTIDLDDLIVPADGSDDYPPMDVPVEPTRVEVGMSVTFAAECGDPAVDLSAEDVTLSAQTADVEAALAEACEAGLVDTADCTLAERVLAALPDSLTVDLPASTLVEAAEPTAQAAAAALCD